MNPMKKKALEALSFPYINLKKYYKSYRKILKAVNAYHKPLYNILDHEILVDNREIPVRVFLPKKKGSSKILIFYHGGGWVTGDIESYTSVCANMANLTGYTVVSVDYRLAPENPFPAGVMDCYHVTREIFLNPHLLNCEQSDITIIGDSAGGNLAAAVSLMARDKGEFLPSRQILIYPATNSDYSEDSTFPSVKENGTDYLLTAKRLQDYMDLYIQNEVDRCNPYVAPILSKDLSHQPKTLIITAEFDPLRDEGEAYGIRLKEFGNPVKIYRMKDAIHGFLTTPLNSKDTIKSYQVINSFLHDNKIEIEE